MAEMQRGPAHGAGVRAGEVRGEAGAAGSSASAALRAQVARTDGHAAQEALLAPGGGPGVGAAPVQRKARNGDQVQDASRPSGAGAVVQREASPGETVSELSGGLVDLRGVSVGFALPGGRQLSSDMTHTLATGDGTRVEVSVSRDRLAVNMSPPLLVDATFPFANVVVRGCGWDFATGAATTDVAAGGGGVNLLSRTTVRERLEALLQGTVGQSAMGRAGYNPLSDRAIMQHLQALRAAFERLPPAPGASTAPLRPRDPSAGVTLAMRDAFLHEDTSSGASVAIPAGGVFSLEVRTEGDAMAAAAAASEGGAAAAAGAVRVTGVTLAGDGITISRAGNPVARIRRMNVHPGGRVEILSFEALGTAAGVQAFEQLLRIVASEGHVAPTLVRQQLEQGLGAGVRSLLLARQNAIPGVNLASIFGVR